MPTYEFVCEECGGLAFTDKSTQPNQCPLGHKRFRRIYDFAGFHRKWDGGFSPTIGRYVPNDREFSDALKAASESASEQLGMEHRFKPMDPRDRDATRITEEDPAPRPPPQRTGGWEKPDV